jgi:hypothetical protein
MQFRGKNVHFWAVFKFIFFAKKLKKPKNNHHQNNTNVTGDAFD